MACVITSSLYKTEPKVKKRSYDRTKRHIEEKKAKAAQLKQYKTVLENEDIGVIKEFDVDLWTGTVRYIKMYSKENVVGRFRDGTEIAESIL